MMGEGKIFDTSTPTADADADADTVSGPGKSASSQEESRTASFGKSAVAGKDPAEGATADEAGES